jgi:hypothetical protein
LRAAADEDCERRNGRQRSDGTTADGFHCSSQPTMRFAAKTSRTNKHEINAGVMSIVEREQWNSSKERCAADQSGTYAMLRRAMRALFAARALGVGRNKRSALRHSCRAASTAVGTGSFATRPVALLVARLYCIVACGSRACAAALSF